MKGLISNSSQVTRLNAATFRFDTRTLRQRGLEVLLDDALAQVNASFGDSPNCSEFVCNLYIRPPQ